MTARVQDANGWYEVPRNPLSRVGVFPYTKKSTQYPGWEGDPGGIVMVYRPQEELSDPETVQSFRLTPWTDNHAMLGNPEVDPNLTSPEKKGVHGTIGEQLEYDPTDRTLYGNVKVWSSSLAAAIDAGKKELSCGFRCVYEFTAGVFEGQPFQAIQRRLRGNHLATVEQGRMGPGIAVLDHFSFAFDASELKEVKPMAKVARKVNVAAKLGVAVAALPAYFGMDAADIDAKALAKWNAVMDAEEDKAEGDDSGGGAGELTISAAAEIISQVAEPLGELQAALGQLASGGNPDAATAEVDEMEPVLDAGGNQVMENGQPKMQKKAKPAAAAASPAADSVPAIAACDAAIRVAKVVSKRMHTAFAGKTAPAGLAAMDEAISNTEKTMTTIRNKPARVAAAAGTALDARVDALEARTAPSFGDITKQLAARDGLAKKVSAFIGTFDHAEMDAAGVATYAAGKFGLTVKPETAVAQVEAYLHNRQPSPAPVGATFGMDSAVKPDAGLSSFILGKTA